ncbi:hypothetical protein GCM10010912_68990 [Paenibacillus albidus]|uniref:Uncharacterized protein n=1 Tax=Paenibacillus albidus TaxID=2041023 RepID=A0A917FZ10_9BACL|nr:hypothetical protein [Paenibacillus albidus]GGG14765.1 hypothetical protein GCM10010912_68990 [Paenibacillus albidus]
MTQKIDAVTRYQNGKESVLEIAKGLGATALQASIEALDVR